MSNDFRPFKLPIFPVSAMDDERSPDIRHERPRRTIHDEISAWFGHMVFLMVFVAAFVPFAVFCYKLTLWVWRVP